MDVCQCRVNENRPHRRPLGGARKGKLRLHTLRLNILLVWDASDTREDAEFCFFLIKSYHWVQSLIDSLTLCPDT